MQSVEKFQNKKLYGDLTIKTLNGKTLLFKLGSGKYKFYWDFYSKEKRLRVFR